MNLDQLRVIYDGPGAFSIIEDAQAGYWIRLKPQYVKAAFERGLAPFSALERPLPGAGGTTYTLTRGTLFVPLLGV